MCKECMRTSVYPLDFNEILNIFKDNKCQFSYKHQLCMLTIVAVEAIVITLTH